MQNFFNSLSEKDKRHYAAVEAQKLGHCGITYIAKLLSCSRSTIHIGLKELSLLSDDSKINSRVRRKGGGRKNSEETIPGLNEAFLAALKDDIAGDPMTDTTRWTHLTHEQIRARLLEQSSISVSIAVIKKLLKKTILNAEKL